MADWAGDVTRRHDSCLLRLICGEESLWSHGSRGTRTLHSTNIFYFQIFSAGGELKYFLCCLAIYLTSICEYIKLLHLTWWMSWLKSSGLGNWNIKYLQPGVISLVRNMLGPDTRGQTARPLSDPLSLSLSLSIQFPTLLTNHFSILTNKVNLGLYYYTLLFILQIISVK